MVKASLRKPTTTKAAPVPKATPAPTQTVSTQVVKTPAQDIEVECINTVATTLEDIVPAAAETETVAAEVVSEAEAPATETGNTTQALATRPDMAVGRANRYEGSGFEGDWGSDDLRFPQIKIVQGSGALSAQFDNGTILYADQILLPPPSQKEGAKNPLLRIVPLSIKKQWRETLDKEAQDAGEMPRVVNSIDEVEELGGTTRWIGGEKPSWTPSARCLFLVEKPEVDDSVKEKIVELGGEEEHPGFALDLDGKQYAVAVYYAGGGAYNASAKIIFNTAMTSLLVPVLDAEGQPKRDEKLRLVKRPLLWKCYWTMGFKKVQFGNYQPWHPVLRLLSKAETGAEVRAYCEQLTQGQAATEEASSAD